MMDGLPQGFTPSATRPSLGALLATVAMLIDDQRSIVLQLTAAQHGEGTTTVARELAAAAARQPWCRVALIDAAPLPAFTDGPSLLSRFERGDEPLLWTGRVGGADVALGRLTGAGEGPPRLESLRGVFAWLRRHYTIAILDCPPILPCRECAITASVADGTLMIVEAERTRRTDIEQAREVLDQLGATILGMVLNKRHRRVPRMVERLM
jgi:Mrp family chromosome partitioning ATPase